jgi:hypothetical protein
MPPLNKFKRFDVRGLLKQGIEPFPEIFAKAQALNAGEGLIVSRRFYRLRWWKDSMAMALRPRSNAGREAIGWFTFGGGEFNSTP